MPQTILPRRWDAALTSVLLGLILHALLNYALSPLRASPYFVLYIVVARVTISALWIQCYRWLTGENGVNPFFNIGFNLVMPWLAERYWRD